MHRIKGFMIIVCDICAAEWDDEPDEDWACEICGLEVCPECREMLFVDFGGVVCVHCGDAVEEHLAEMWEAFRNPRRCDEID